MKRMLLILFLAQMVVGDILKDYYQSNLVFTRDFYEKVLSSVQGNFLFSPASIQAALAIVAVGGRGETGKELSEAAHFYEITKIEEMYLKLDEKLSAVKSNLVNHVDIYVGSATLNAHYDVHAQYAFKATITRQPVLPHRDVLTESSFVFSNGIVIEHLLILTAEWNIMFDKGSPKRFYLNKSQTETIDTLYTKQELNYYYDEVLGAEFLEIPFTDNELTFIIALPDRIGLLDLEKYICEILAPHPYEKMSISVTIPYNWNPYASNIVFPLESLGVIEPFSNRANFTGISNSHPKVTEVIHKTFFNVTEEASGEDIIPEDLPAGPRKGTFVANHPFMYYIRHSVLGVVAIGRYVKP